MNSVLVTGGAGYIGSHTCKALRQAGFTPVVYDNLTRGNLEAVKWGELEIGDLTDGVRLRAALARHRPTGCVHFAALAYVGESTAHPETYYANNVGGTAVLLDALREHGVRHLVFSSSCVVYSTTSSAPIPETNELAPINPYGVTKMICERMLRECASAFPLNFVALRYFNAAGADPGGEIGECHVPETHAIPLLLDAAASDAATFTIFGDDYPTPDGTCVRDYVHVADLADVHVRALRALMDGSTSMALNVGTGRGWSVRELVNVARQITQRAIAVRVGPRRSGDPAILIANSTRVRERLGWQPRYADLALQIAHAWAWHQGGVKNWQRMQAALRAAKP